MLRRHLTVMLIAAAFLTAVGCQKEASDEHLLDIAVKLAKQQQQLDRIDTTVQSIQERFDGIEGSLITPPVVGTAGPEAGRGEGQPTNVVSSKEYQDIMGQMAVVQSQLVSLEEEILMLR